MTTYHRPPLRFDPIVQDRPLFGAMREEALALAADLRRQISDVDNELVSLSARRGSLTKDLAAVVARLTAHIRHRRGRMPAPDGSEQLPAVTHDATPLWGRRLRSVCLAILRRAGRLTLPEIHALLHRHGHVIESDTSVKVLADALGYEVERGRARRVSRGVYEVDGPLDPP